MRQRTTISGKKISIVDDIREGFQKQRLFLMTFAIKRRTPLPLNGTFFHPFIIPFFSSAIEFYVYGTDFTVGLIKKISI